MIRLAGSSSSAVEGRPTLLNSIILLPLLPLLIFGLFYQAGRFWPLILCFTIRESILLYPLIRSRKVDYFDPVIYSIPFSFIGDYRIFYLIFYEDFSSEFWNMTQSEAIYYGSLVLLYQAIGLIAIYAGYYSSFGNSLSSKWPAPSTESWDQKRLYALIFIMSVLGIASYLFITIATAGNPLNYIQHAETYKREIGALATFLRTAQLPVIACFLWFGYHLTRKKTVLFWLYLVSSLALVGSIGQRSYVIIPLLILMIIRHYLVRPIEIWRGIALGLFIVIFAVVMMDVRASRYQNRQGELNFNIVRTKEYSPLIILNDWIRDRRSYDVFVGLIHRVPTQIEYQFGRSYLYYLVAPVPRFLWPNKRAFITENSVDEGTIVNAPYQPPGFLSGLYLNFSLPGIIAGCFLWGILLKAMYAWLKNNPENRGVVILYAISLVCLADGPTPVTISHWLNFFLPVVVSLWYLKVRLAKTEPAPAQVTSDKSLPALDLD
jgi:hypothetical protein